MEHHHDFGERSWPFDTPINTATFTTTFVLDGSLPILEVYHDHDGEWQFMCGTTNDSAHAKLVCLGCMLERDESLFVLADMQPGWCAFRSSPGEPWTREQYADSDVQGEV